VHPLLPIQGDSEKDTAVALAQIKKWFLSMHGFVIGPGLGRSEFLGGFLEDLIASMNESQLIIIDADGLWALMNNEGLSSLLCKRKGVFLTPNVGEFDRLWGKLMGGKARFST
jgi:NAD(P)H-hydrate repair Nnr-like enzyme with NAD(P)H-hydrate dehydratase domain